MKILSCCLKSICNNFVRGKIGLIVAVVVDIITYPFSSNPVRAKKKKKKQLSELLMFKKSKTQRKRNEPIELISLSCLKKQQYSLRLAAEITKDTSFLT